VVLTTGGFHSSPDALQKEIAARYSGHFVIGRDLDGARTYKSRGKLCEG
jgi:hypothetical protein